MTNQELNLAIAKAQGFTNEVIWLRPRIVLDDGGYRSIPDYANDLNACHEARKAITTPAQKVAYQSHLYALAAPKCERKNRKGDGLPSDYDAHTQGPREIAEAILKALETEKPATP